MSSQESLLMTHGSWPPKPCYAGHRPLDTLAVRTCHVHLAQLVPSKIRHGQQRPQAAFSSLANYCYIHGCALDTATD